MSPGLVKVADNIYVEWSTGCDAPRFIGSREDITEYLLRHDNAQHVEERLARTDERGHSWVDRPPGLKGLVYDQRGWLPAARFAEFFALLMGIEDPADRYATDEQWSALMDMLTDGGDTEHPVDRDRRAGT